MHENEEKDFVTIVPSQKWLRFSPIRFQVHLFTDSFLYWRAIFDDNQCESSNILYWQRHFLAMRRNQVGVEGDGSVVGARKRPIGQSGKNSAYFFPFRGEEIDLTKNSANFHELDTKEIV